MTASSRLVHGPEGHDRRRARARVHGAGQERRPRPPRRPVFDGGGITIPQPSSAFRRHSSGNRWPSGPRVRPAAGERDRRRPRIPRARTRTIWRPEAQLVTPVPVGAIVMARMSTRGSRNSTASAAMSLTSTSVSTMIGMRAVGGSPVTSGGSVASVPAPQAPTSRGQDDDEDGARASPTGWHALHGRAAATPRTQRSPSARRGTPIEPDPLPGEPLRGGVPREVDEHLERDGHPARWRRRPTAPGSSRSASPPRTRPAARRRSRTGRTRCPGRPRTAPRRTAARRRAPPSAGRSARSRRRSPRRAWR